MRNCRRSGVPELQQAIRAVIVNSLARAILKELEESAPPEVRGPNAHPGGVGETNHSVLQEAPNGRIPRPESSSQSR